MKTQKDKYPIVVSKSLRFPFSKGILSQGLLAIGLKPEEAYGIAEKAEARLLNRKSGQIEKDHLKRLVYDLLRREYGQKMAHRYLEWKSLSSPILVKEESSGVPFSKGILSQSLEASGIEPTISHSLAMTIEKTLMRRPNREVTRDELRDLTVRTLKRKYGYSYANRYLLWRRLKEPVSPLIILLGGTAGTGKSTLAVEIAHRLGITRVISTDSVREVMRIMLSPELMPTIHKSSFDAWQTYDLPRGVRDDVVIAAFMEQALRVSAGIYALMDRALNEKISTIIDGVHIVPGFMKRNYAEKTLVCKMVITTEDEDIHRERFQIRAQQASTRGAEKYLSNFGSIRKIQDFVVLQAQKHNVPVFDNRNFDQTVATIVEYLTAFVKTHDRTPLRKAK
ncbi:MAG: AAA family ATPase [Candidatus Hydrogenedentota bacterium]|nr:MAG: AAA family ATPase [Candidatus Hydrogenedentota bacterium]